MRYITREKAIIYRFSMATPDEGTLPPDYQWTPITQDVLGEFFGRSPKYKWHLRSYSRLVGKGYIGSMIYHGPQWAAVQWIAMPDSVGPPHLPARLSDNRYWCFYEHTHEEHRRKGLWRALKAININRAREAAGDPAFPVYSDTEFDNAPSRKAHESFGFEPESWTLRTSIRIPKIKTLSFASEPQAFHDHSHNQRD